MVKETLEWKFKATIARSTMFEGHLGQIFAQFESKMVKKIIFNILL